MKYKSLGFLVLAGILLFSCSKVNNDSDKDITIFAIADQITSVITNTSEAVGTIAVTMPNDTNLAALTPTIAISTGASISPASGVVQNFTTVV